MAAIAASHSMTAADGNHASTASPRTGGAGLSIPSSSSGQTPAFIPASPSQAAALGLALHSNPLGTPEHTLATLTNANAAAAQGRPRLGPRVVLHLLVDQQAVESSWPATSSIVHRACQQIAALHRGQPDGPSIVVQAIAYPSAQHQQQHRASPDPIQSFFEPTNECRKAGPLLPKSFLLSARECLRGDASEDGWHHDGVSTGYERGLERGLDDLKAEINQQSSSSSTSTLQEAVLTRYLVHIASAASKGSEPLSTSAKEAAEALSASFNGIVTATLAAAPWMSKSSERSQGSEAVALQASSTALLSELGPSTSWEDLGNPECKPSGEASTFFTTPLADLEGARITLAGFKPLTPGQAGKAKLDSASKKRAREEAGESEGSGKKQRVEANGAEATTSGTTNSSAAAVIVPAYPGHKDMKTPPPFWSGPIVWDVQKPGAAGGKQHVTVWVSAMVMSGVKGSQVAPLQTLLMPWPKVLPLSQLQPISWPLLQAFAATRTVPLIMLGPQAAPGLRPTPSGEKMPETPEEQRRNEQIYTSLARTLDSKRSGVWLSLKDNPMPPHMMNSNPEESRTSPGVLVVSLPNIDPQTGQPRPVGSRLVGFIFANGVPWDSLQTPQQRAQVAELNQQQALLARARAQAALLQAQGQGQGQQQGQAPIAPTSAHPPSGSLGGGSGGGGGGAAPAAGGSVPRPPNANADISSLFGNVSSLPPQAQQMLSAALAQQQALKQHQQDQYKPLPPRPMPGAPQQQQQQAQQQGVPNLGGFNITQQQGGGGMPQNVANLQAWLAAQQQQQQRAQQGQGQASNAQQAQQGGTGAHLQGSPLSSMFGPGNPNYNTPAGQQFMQQAQAAAMASSLSASLAANGGGGGNAGGGGGAGQAFEGGGLSSVNQKQQFAAFAAQLLNQQQQQQQQQQGPGGGGSGGGGGPPQPPAPANPAGVAAYQAFLRQKQQEMQAQQQQHAQQQQQQQGHAGHSRGPSGQMFGQQQPGGGQQQHGMPGPSGGGNGNGGGGGGGQQLMPNLDLSNLDINALQSMLGMK